jgi:hypothetical protein
LSKACSWGDRLHLRVYHLLLDEQADQTLAVADAVAFAGGAITLRDSVGGILYLLFGMRARASGKPSARQQ